MGLSLVHVLIMYCRFVFQSPDGNTVASAAGDETLRFWNVFGSPEVAKAAPKANPEPFAHLSRIR